MSDSFRIDPVENKTAKVIPFFGQHLNSNGNSARVPEAPRIGPHEPKMRRILSTSKNSKYEEPRARRKDK